MRVLHLETGKNLYGGADQVLTLMRGLIRRDIENVLVCVGESEVAAASRAQGLETVAVTMSGDVDLGFIWRFRGLIDQLNADLVHVHSRRGADTLGGLAARMSGVPAVVSRRVDSADTPVVGTLKYRLYQRVIAISSAIRRQLAERGVPEAKLAVVRDAIETDAFPPAWSAERFRREFDLAQADLPIAVVAQLIERKGHRYLFEALTRCHRDTPDLRVILFGIGPLAKQLQKEVEHLGLEGVVRFAGFRPDLRAFLRHFKLLLHPALREGLGLCLLEAQAVGVPVVGFRSGGVAEAVADGETGVLVPPGDVSGLADALGSVLNDVDRRHRLGAAGPGWVRQEFGVERMVDGYLNIYSQVVGGNTGEEGDVRA